MQVIPNHQTNGIGEVLRVIEKDFLKQKAVGIIDNDKANKELKAKFFGQFQKEKEENHLIRLKHPDRQSYLILLCPALERFILFSAKECGIPENEIPYTKERLRRLAKSKDVEKDQQLKQFLNRIIQKKAPGTETLKTWLREIIGDEP
jgi:hypothetical protein